MRSRALHDAPLAITSDGAIVANATHVLKGHDPHELLDVAMKTGRRVFVGVLLDDGEVGESLKRIDDAAAEMIATVVKLGT